MTIMDLSRAGGRQIQQEQTGNNPYKQLLCKGLYHYGGGAIARAALYDLGWDCVEAQQQGRL